MTSIDPKRAAAEAALRELPPRGVIGLGSGTTAALFVEALAATGRDYTCVPTSNATRILATALGLRLLDDEGPWDIDVTVDGADEVSDALDLIKGGGGAHTREKIVNRASRTNVIVVDASKRSPFLGQKWPIPVEILPFGAKQTIRTLEAFGHVHLRTKKSDAGNLLVDVETGLVSAPGSLEETLRSVTGVVEVGLFVGRADVVLVAGRDGRITRLAR